MVTVLFFFGFVLYQTLVGYDIYVVVAMGLSSFLSCSAVVMLNAAFAYGKIGPVSALQQLQSIV